MARIPASRLDKIAGALRKLGAGQSLTASERSTMDWAQSYLGASRPLGEYAPRTQRRKMQELRARAGTPSPRARKSEAREAFRVVTGRSAAILDATPAKRLDVLKTSTKATDKELARRLGVSERQIRRWRAGGEISERNARKLQTTLTEELARAPHKLTITAQVKIGDAYDKRRTFTDMNVTEAQATALAAAVAAGDDAGIRDVYAQIINVHIELSADYETDVSAVEQVGAA